MGFSQGALFNKLGVPCRADRILVSVKGAFRMINRVNARCSRVNLTSPVSRSEIICIVFFVVLFRRLLNLLRVVNRRLSFLVFDRRFKNARSCAIRVSVSEALRAPSAKLLRAPPVLGEVTSRRVKESNDSNVIPVTRLRHVRHRFGRHAINSMFKRDGPIACFRRVVYEGLGTKRGSRSAIFGRRRRSNDQDAGPNRRCRQEFVCRCASGGGSSGRG